jgi:spore coat protein U-like protein
MRFPRKNRVGKATGVCERRGAALALAVIACWTGQLSTAAAATATTTFAVNSTVNAACAILASNLSFGLYDPTATTATSGSTNLGLTCTNGTPYDVGLDEGVGAGATVALRKMNAGGSNNLTYSLYSDSAHTSVWGETVGADTVAGTGAGVAQSLTVYGLIPAQQTVQPGVFTDTITVTVTY